jgi:hypothetical protein
MGHVPDSNVLIYPVNSLVVCRRRELSPRLQQSGYFKRLFGYELSEKESLQRFVEGFFQKLKRSYKFVEILEG